ncbi:MAG: type II secretion system F family protein [Acidimicrobiia bacterium]
MILLAALAAGAAILLVIVAFAWGASERAEVRDSLRQLDSYQIADVREQEMLAPVGERVLAPVSDAMVNVARRFTPAGFVDGCREKWVLAGSPAHLSPDKILLYKGLGIVSLPIWVVVFTVMGWWGLVGILAFAFIAFASFMLPDVSLNRAVEDRQQRIARELADMLDLLVISVEAGLGFEQALDRTVNAIPGALADEFRRVLQEIRIGASRADALRALDARTDVPELRSFILAMLQADAFGVSISKILRQQAEELRVRRRFKIQEKAQKAPVKMLFPLVFCIFPAILVVVLGPAVLRISEVLG